MSLSATLLADHWVVTDESLYWILLYTLGAAAIVLPICLMALLPPGPPELRGGVARAPLVLSGLAVPVSFMSIFAILLFLFLIPLAAVAVSLFATARVPKDGKKASSLIALLVSGLAAAHLTADLVASLRAEQCCFH